MMQRERFQGNTCVPQERRSSVTAFVFCAGSGDFSVAVLLHFSVVFGADCFLIPGLVGLHKISASTCSFVPNCDSEQKSSRPHITQRHDQICVLLTATISDIFNEYR
jgi:hypothetical protein